MRNSTKLKTLLLKYTVSLDLEDDVFRLMLTDKVTAEGHLVEGPSYSHVLSKAYSFLLKKMKSEFPAAMSRRRNPHGG
jgi:hypothetical protein